MSNIDLLPDDTDDDLVFVGPDGEPFTTSLVIAHETGVQHKNVIELLRANLSDFETFGPLAFETRRGAALPQGGFAKSTEVGLLNEGQATLLITFMRNNEIVRALKVRLVQAFLQMRKMLTQQAAPAVALPDRRALARMVLEAEDRADEAERQRVIECKNREAAEAYARELEPKAEYVDNFVSPDDCVQFRTLANQLNVCESDLRQLLTEKKWIYRTHIGKRFSKKVGKLVDEYEWRAYSERRHYFRLFPQHNAPRHHNNQLRQTLYVTPPGAQEIRKMIGSDQLNFGDAEVSA